MDPTWSYGKSVLFNSNDFGTTTQPGWSYGASALLNEYPTLADIPGVYFTYGESKRFISDESTVETEFYLGASILRHQLRRWKLHGGGPFPLGLWQWRAQAGGPRYQ